MVCKIRRSVSADRRLRPQTLNSSLGCFSQFLPDGQTPLHHFDHSQVTDDSNSSLPGMDFKIKALFTPSAVTIRNLGHDGYYGYHLDIIDTVFQVNVQEI